LRTECRLIASVIACARIWKIPIAACSVEVPSLLEMCSSIALTASCGSTCIEPDRKLSSRSQPSATNASVLVGSVPPLA